MTREQDRPWQPLSPREVAAVLQAAPFAWWIAGGLAIEAFVGRAFRPHGDIDILMLRQDRMAARALLQDWDCRAADPPGTLRPWPVDEVLPETVGHVWCRRGADDPWRFQLMLDDGDGRTWRSRRAAAVSRAVSQMGWRDADGLPFLAAEIQLFYKAKGIRPKDEEDFAAALPLMTAAQKAWLREAISQVHDTEHAWLARLG